MIKSPFSLNRGDSLRLTVEFILSPTGLGSVVAFVANSVCSSRAFVSAMMDWFSLMKTTSSEVV